MKQLPHRRHTSSITITFILMALIVVAAISVGNFSSRRSAEKLQTEAGKQLEELAYQMSDKADRGIHERYRDVQNTLRSPLLTDRRADAEARKLVVENTKDVYPEYSFVAITDTTGMITTSADDLLINASAAARPWFKNALAAEKNELIVEDVHEAVLLAKLLPNPSNEPLRFIDIAGPIYDEQDQLRGVLGIHLSFGWIDDIRNSLLKSNEQRNNAEVLILSSNNDVLLGPDEVEYTNISTESARAIQPGVGGFITETWPDGKDYLVGYYGSTGFDDYKGLGWKILVRQPADTAFSLATEQRQNLLIGAATLGAIIALIAGALMWRILKRQRQLETVQQDFISFASHQLRTPATGIKQFLGMVLEGYAGKLTKEQREIIQDAYDSNERQIDITEDLLNLAKLQSGHMKLRVSRVDLVSLTQEVIDQYKLTATKRHITLIADLPDHPMVIKGDPHKLQMVFDNLVSNAIKYSPDYSNASIILAEHDKTMIWSIKDQGVGVDSKDISKLFRRMSRISNARSSEVTGTGLGLYLANEVVQLHGGTIEVSSELGKGTTFIIKLPTEK